MTTKKDRPLSPQQEMFKNYLVMGEPIREAFEKCYKSRGYVASACINKLLKIPKIAEAVRDAKNRAAYQAEVTLERVLQEEKCLAYSNVADMFDGEILIPPDKLPEEAQRALSAVEITETEIAGVKTTKYKYRFWDKGRSLERLGKVLGIFEKDNSQQSAKIGNITVRFISADGEETNDG